MTQGEEIVSESGERRRDVEGGARGSRRLRVLHVIIMLGETNSQYNEHCLPSMGTRELSISTYFTPRLEPPSEIELFAGDGTLRGFFRAFADGLEAGERDVIHVHAPQTGALVTLALAARPTRWRLRRKLVFTVHDSFYDYKLRDKLLMLLPFVTSRRVVFCGHAAYQSYPTLWRRLVSGRMRVVQNAADLARVDSVAVGRARSRNGNGFDVLSVGRLERVKDPLTLLRAFGQLADGRARLSFVGAGALEATLVDEIGASGLADCVELTGLVPRDDVFARCAEANLFVSTSHGEGLPVAVIEAMATGCPVVLSDIPPHREVADGADFVPFVRPSDVRGFAREIDRFRAMSSADREQVGVLCREHVRSRFGLQVMEAGYETVYRELL